MFAGYRAILAEPRSKTNSAEGEYAGGGGGGGGAGARFDQHGGDNMNPYPFAPMGGKHQRVPSRLFVFYKQTTENLKVSDMLGSTLHTV